MQQIRRQKPTARQRMTVAKSARNGSSAEQMLVELKRRLREISDLTAAGDVLNWNLRRRSAAYRGHFCQATGVAKAVLTRRRRGVSCGGSQTARGTDGFQGRLGG